VQESEVDNRISTCPNCGEFVPAVEQLQKDIDELRLRVDQLHEQVHRDNLTGLFNHRYFAEALDREMERTRRSGRATGLIMIDLDHFKKVNDLHGHEAGNTVLQKLARLINAATRKLDIACRYGGEEFAVILPSTDLLTSAQVAERLRKLIEMEPIAIGAEQIHLTVSLGVDVYSGFHSETQEDFVKHVDDLLYRAKRGGRNRVRAGKRRDMQRRSIVNAEERDALRGLYSRNRDK